MSKKSEKQMMIWQLILLLLLGAAVFTLFCLLASYGVREGWLPIEAKRAAALTALLISTTAIAAVGRGGRTSFTLGIMYAALFLIWKILSVGLQQIGWETGIGALICVLCPWMFSCIFHKKTRKNTKRNRRKSRRI